MTDDQSLLAPAQETQESPTQQELPMTEDAGTAQDQEEVSTEQPGMTGEDQPKVAEGPEAAVPDKTKAGEPIWSGNPDDLPEQMRPRAKEVLRYFTKRSQAMSDAEKKAKWVEEFVSSGEWDKYNQWRQGAVQAQPQRGSQAQQGLVSAEELEDIYSDPKKLSSFIERKLEDRISREKSTISRQLAQLQQEQARFQARTQIEDFAQMHPKFWEYYDAGIAQPIIREVCDVQGKTLNDAFQIMEEVDKKLTNRVQKATQARVQQKKAAVTQAPTAPNESDILWVDSHEEARNMATELAMQKSNKVVRVKDKSKVRR